MRVEWRLSFVTFAVAIVLLVVVGCQRQLMPTPNLFLNQTRDPFADVPAEYQSNRVELLYATDRMRLEDPKGVVPYGFGRSPSLVFGRAVISIGKDESWGELVEQSRNKRTKKLGLVVEDVVELGRFPATPRPARFVDGRVIVDPEVLVEVDLAQEAMRNELVRRLSATARKEAFVFIHGFNNDFEDAAFVMAELWHFLGRQGVPIIYSWPAGRATSTRGYNYDRESGEFTVYHLKEFLRTLASCAELEKFHLIAHSRGTDVATTALRELNIEFAYGGQDPQGLLKLGNLVLAAADMDMGVTLQRLASEYVGRMAEHVTIYSSSEDKALEFADLLFLGFNRLGQVGAPDLPPEIKQIITRNPALTFIHARVETGFLGHGYFRNNAAVASDLILLLRYNRSPGREHGRPLKPIEPNFWEIEDGYPFGEADERSDGMDSP